MLTAIVFCVLVVIVISQAVRIVPQQSTWIVEHFGKHSSNYILAITHNFTICHW